MKKNTSWKFMDKSSVTFQLSISGPGEFGLKVKINILFDFFSKEVQARLRVAHFSKFSPSVIWPILSYHIYNSMHLEIDM